MSLTTDTRSPALDGIRGLAILMVLAHNTLHVAPEGGVLAEVVARVSGIGWNGVTLFFVLSGFLITRGLMEEQGSPTYFRAFYLRRALRIFPLYYLFLVFFLLVLPALDAAPQGIVDDLPRQIWYWLYLSNWTQFADLGGSGLPHLWSLAVEEQFYLLWPLLVWRRTPRQVLGLCLGAIALAFVARVVLVLAGVEPMQIYTFTITRIDALAVGGVAAVWVHQGTAAPRFARRPAWLLGLAGAALLLGRVIPGGYGMDDPVGQTVGYLLFGIAFAALVLATQVADSGRGAWWVRGLRLAPLRSLGRYSYAIYLFHMPIHSMVVVPAYQRMGQDLPMPLPEALAVALVSGLLTVVAGWLSYHLIEKRFLGLKERVAPRWRPAAAV